MPLTHDEALALKPGDRLTLDGHDLPFTVTEVRPLANGFQVFIVRDDWHGTDQATFFEPEHLGIVHPHTDMPPLADATPSFLPTEDVEAPADDAPADDKPARKTKKTP